MKTHFIKVTALVFFLALISCGKNNSAIVLNTKEGVEQVKKILEDEFDVQKEITSLSFSNKNTISNELDQITVMFPENNKNTMWFYSLTMAKLFKPESTEKSNSEDKTIKLKAFNLDEIPIHFDAAVAMVQKKTSEFSNFQTDSHFMNVNENMVSHSFTLFADKLDGKPSFYGTRVEGNKFKFSFSTNDKGVLICSNGLNIF